MAPPLDRIANSILPRQESTVSTAFTVGSILPEWPTMSALAKLTIITSNVPSSVALITASAMPEAFFAGEWLLYAAVEEVCNVRVLLSFGDAQVAHVEIAHHVGQNIRHGFRRN